MHKLINCIHIHKHVSPILEFDEELMRIIKGMNIRYKWVYVEELE